MLTRSHPYVNKHALDTMLMIIKADGPCLVSYVKADCKAQINVSSRDILFTTAYMRQNAEKLGIVFIEEEEEETVELI